MNILHLHLAHMSSEANHGKPVIVNADKIAYFFALEAVRYWEQDKKPVRKPENMVKIPCTCITFSFQETGDFTNSIMVLETVDEILRAIPEA